MKFETKIKILIHTLIAFILLISVVFTYLIIKIVYDNDFLVKTTEFARQYNNRSDYLMEALEKSAQSVVTDSRIITAAQRTVYNPEINDILNNAMKSNLNIIGITFYGTYCTYATDTVIGSNPDKKYIIDNFLPKNFLGSNTQKIWVLRNKDSYNGYYRRSRYKVNYGVYTCIQKIFNTSDSCVGFLVLDIDCKTLFSLYSENNDFLGKIKLYLRINGEITDILNNGEIKDELSKKDAIISEHKLLNSDNSIIMVVSKNIVYDGMRTLMCVIISAAIIWYIICIFLSRALINSITLPMNSLNEKFSQYNHGEENEK